MSESKLETTRAIGLCSFCHSAPCICPPEAKEAQKALAEYKVTPETSKLLGADQQTLETFTNPWAPDRRVYGALPHFDERDAIIANFADEAAYFGKHYETGKGPEWRDSFYAEGDLLFELKFGKSLSDFADEILDHYPRLLHGPGREVSLFGLSGAGKSTALETLRELMGKNETVVIDSDTVRFNLLAKMVKDVEMEAGATLEEVKNQLIHNNISGALYFLLNHVTKELRERGYNIVQASTQPTTGADVTVYMEHPDGIDPLTVTDEQLPAVAKQLYERTQDRVHGTDNFDWDNGKTVTRFNKMKDVTVQVPERVHSIFVKNIREVLQKNESGEIKTLRNPLTADPLERKQMLRGQLKEILGERGEKATNLTLEQVKNLAHLEIALDTDFSPLLEKINASRSAHGKTEFDSRDGFHLTIISPTERGSLENLTLAQFQELKEIVEDLQRGRAEFTVEGIGHIDGSKDRDIRPADKEKETCFIAVQAFELNEFRKKLGLPPKDFHITLGFVGGDIHMALDGKDEKGKDKLRRIDKTAKGLRMREYEQFIPEIHLGYLTGPEKQAKAEKPAAAPVAEKPVVRYNSNALRSSLEAVCLQPGVGAIITPEKISALVEAATVDAVRFNQMLGEMGKDLKGAMKLVREAVKTSEVK